MQDSRLEEYESAAQRLKSVLKVRTDKALAQLLGISPTAYAIRKRKRSLPVEQIVSLCIERRISLDFVFLFQKTA